MIRALSTSQFLDFLGIRLESERVAGMAFTINLITPDTDQHFVIELSNSTLTNLEGHLGAAPDLTLTVGRAHLEEVMVGATTLQQLAQDRVARFHVDPTVLAQLAALMTHFEIGFEIMPGTGAVPEATMFGAFKQEPLGDTSGG